MAKRLVVGRVAIELASHRCPECGTVWECGSRHCLENEVTKCGKCPCSVPICYVPEQGNLELK